MEKYEDNLHEDELSIWVDWLDAEDVLQPPQEAAEEAEIMVPGSVPDGEAGSEQAAMVRKYQQGPQSEAQVKKSLKNQRYRQKKKLKAALALESDLPAHKTAKSSVSKRPYIPKGRVCRFCKKKGHIKKTCPQNPDGRPRQDRRRKCFKCGSREHSAAACKAAPL